MTHKSQISNTNSFTRHPLGHLRQNAKRAISNKEFLKPPSHAPNLDASPMFTQSLSYPQVCQFFAEMPKSKNHDQACPARKIWRCQSMDIIYTHPPYKKSHFHSAIFPHPNPRLSNLKPNPNYKSKFQIQKSYSKCKIPILSAKQIPNPKVQIQRSKSALQIHESENPNPKVWFLLPISRSNFWYSSQNQVSIFRIITPDPKFQF